MSFNECVPIGIYTALNFNNLTQHLEAVMGGTRFNNRASIRNRENAFYNRVYKIWKIGVECR